MFRYPKGDLNANELSALRELCVTGLLKVKTSEKEEAKLVRLRYAQRTDRGLIATARGRQRAFSKNAEYV